MFHVFGFALSSKDADNPLMMLSFSLLLNGLNSCIYQLVIPNVVGIILFFDNCRLQSYKIIPEPPSDSDKTFILSRKFRGFNVPLFCKISH